MPSLLESAEELDLFRRALTPRGVSIDDRTFEAVATTEERVVVPDYSAWEMIDEVLVADGVRFMDHTPLFEDHRSYTSGANIGHVTETRQDGRQWIAKTQVAEPFDERDPAGRAWARVRDGHQRDVSIGYWPESYVDIDAGESAAVAGRRFTAGKRRLRVVTDTLVYELSLVGIGADPHAKVRRAWAAGRTHQTTPRRPQPPTAVITEFR
ncbi:MAG: hypothetical protein AAF805_00130 [Planctomycetota bacterium]